MARFSKQLLLSHLDAQILELQDEYKFDPMNGWAQVEGKGEERNRKYGEYDALLRLSEQIESGL